MRITFVALGWERLGISLLSAIAKHHGNMVDLAFSPSLFNDRYNLKAPFLASFFDDRKEVIASIRRQRPDVLVFSPLTGTYQWTLSIAKEAKMILPFVKTIFGGAHVSAVPDRVISQPQVDYVCVGEGDVAFPAILRAISEGGGTAPIINTRYKLADGEVVKGVQAGFIEDLDALPVFDKTLWEDHICIGDWYLTMASRGCPYRCAFCFNSYFAQLPDEKAGKYVRRRSVKHMMRELHMAKRRYKLRFLEFEDDVFTMDKKWLKEFLDWYKKEIDVPFQCLTHPRYMDEDIARWLSEAGCRYVQMGIQSMDDEFKCREIHRYERSEHIYRAMEVMRKYKIRAKVDHMFGLPGESMKAQEDARKLYIQHPPYRIQTFWTNFLPGTELVKRGLEVGLITPDEVKRLNEGLDFDFYRDSEKGMSPQKRKKYKAYEALFKLIPVLPGPLRRTIGPGFFERLPVPVCSLISFAADAVIGLATGNPDHWIYARHYIYHMVRFCLKKIGITMPPATRVIETRIPLPLREGIGEGDFRTCHPYLTSLSAGRLHKGGGENLRRC
ncbi:MAG: B12-binding domain-containing radical SAM protein [Candidatus Omnitrophica bacterium]|nr:B12-binding domain-containing radical SAM protein [Candidatus Omnitrophota bacterium]